MFKGITWQDYLLTLGVALVIYYLLYVLIFQRAWLKKVMSGRIWDKAYQEGAFDPQMELDFDTNNKQGNFTLGQTSDETFAELETLIAKIKTTIASSSGSQVFDTLKSVIQTYIHFKATIFQSTINELISEELEKVGLAAPTGDVLDWLWVDDGA